MQTLQMQNSMIFKTFDSYIDKWTSKIGILGKSFNEIGNAVNDAFKSVIDNIDNFNEDVSFGESLKHNLFPKKEDIQSKLIDIDSVLPKIDENQASEILNFIKSIEDGTNEVAESFQTLYDTKDKNKQWIAQYAQETQGQIRTIEGVIEANQAARKAAIDHNNALKQQTLSFKAATAASKAFAIAGNMLAFWAISKGIQLAATAFDNYIHKVEKAKEAMEEAVSAYDSAKSSLQNINSELDENNKKIDELETKGKLTFVEKDQLEELKQITEQLELQKELAEWELENKKKEAATTAIAYVNEKYNLGDSNAKDVDRITSDISSETYLKFDAEFDDQITDAEYLAAKYKAATGELKNLIDERHKLPDDSENVVFMDNDILEHEQSIEDLKADMDDMLLSLMEQKANIQDYYDSIKDTPYEEMSTDAKSCYDTMQQINSAMQTLYYGYGNNRFNNEIINDIFNTDGIEKTKDELIEMAEAGTLNPAVLASYEALAEAILNSNLVADEGCGVFETLCNEIYALAEAEKEAQDSAVTDIQVISISDTIDQLNTQLKPAFNSLKSAYQDIFTDDKFTPENVSVDMLQSIKKEIDELNENEGISIDYSSFEEFAQVLSDTSSKTEDVQEQFNSLMNTIIYSTGSLDVNADNFNVLSKSLEEMGLVNAKDVLSEITEVQKEFQSVSEELGLTLQDVANATYEETVQMLIEAQASGKDTQALFKLSVAKGNITDGTISTESNVDALLAEAQAAGLDTATLTALENVRNGNIKDSKAAQAIVENARKEIMESMSDFNCPGYIQRIRLRKPYSPA